MHATKTQTAVCFSVKKGMCICFSINCKDAGVCLNVNIQVYVLVYALMSVEYRHDVWIHVRDGRDTHTHTINTDTHTMNTGTHTHTQ